MHFRRLTSPYSKRCTGMLRILRHPDIETADRLRHTDAVSEPNMDAVINWYTGGVSLCTRLRLGYEAGLP